MKDKGIKLLSVLALGSCLGPVMAQRYSSTSNLTALPTADRNVPFKLSEQGVVRQVEWGTDMAWSHEQNLRRCVAFMGKDNVEVVRASFQPTYELIDGDLQQEQKDAITERLRLLGFCNKGVKLMLNCDNPSVDSWYEQNAEHWAQLIDVTTSYFQKAGYNVVSVAPFNEPDYGWSQWVPGSQDSNETNRMKGFAAVAAELRGNTRFDSIRICGGNTLNCDRATPWYSYLKSYLDEGNTHQLAGTFDSFASFYTTLASDGKHATDDEMHNVMEAMVGLEYGLQTGIWWGPAEYARGEFCKASHGERLAYAEHRSNWTAASVYRSTDGKVQAFGGTSERQAATTSYRFLSKDRDVFFDGHGPQREYVMELPGGTGYQTGQSNAEQVVNITWGEDVQPVVEGTYLLFNKGNKQVLDIKNNSPYYTYYSNSKATQQWNVNRVDPTIGGDFSYYQIVSASTSQTLDVNNYSLDDKASVILYSNSQSSNQQWYLDYAGDGWFRIRNRHSSLCLGILGNSIVQTEVSSTNNNQLWRFLPTGVTPRVRTISDIPTNVAAEARDWSVKLTWNQTSATKPTYTILRAEAEDGDYCIIARNVDDTAFVDNKVKAGTTYYYKVKTVDVSLNTSAASAVVSATPSGGDGLLARYEFEENANDTTVNLNNAAVSDAASFADGKSGGYALSMTTTDAFAQLPADIADHKQLTVAAWVYWKGSSNWQRVFDFGNGEDEYMFLTTRASSGKLRFAIKNNGDEQSVDGGSMTAYRNKWVHIAVTLGDDSVTVYVDGEPVASSTTITLRPTDFHPLVNYVGHSQFAADPNFNGYVDDLRIYSYALSGDEVKNLVDDANGIDDVTVAAQSDFSVDASSANRQMALRYSQPNGESDVVYNLYDLQGKLVKTVVGRNGETTTFDASAMAGGVYVVQAQCGRASRSQKVVVK